MTGNLLAKRLKQAYEERYCNGTYSLELEGTLDKVTCYVFTYTYNDGYRVCLEITISSLGEVKFYSPVHCYYISSFGKSYKSAINVVRMLFDLLECNRETMLRYYGEEPEQPTEEVAEQEQPTEEVAEQEQPTEESAEQATCINTICDNNKESEDKTMTNEIELRETASNLYDGGWRASDREYLKAEYDFSEWELDIICEALLDFEA